jgi:hypothetical protein
MPSDQLAIADCRLRIFVIDDWRLAIERVARAARASRQSTIVNNQNRQSAIDNRQ